MGTTVSECSKVSGTVSVKLAKKVPDTFMLSTFMLSYDWYHQAMASGVRHCQEFARTLLANAHGILAWYRHRISKGKVEGTNNKIKTMNRQHYGLRVEEFFILMLYLLHETKYALVG